jgi:hypothetical protein
MASSVEICSREVEGLQQSLDAVAVRVETTRIELVGLGSLQEGSDRIA